MIETKEPMAADPDKAPEDRTVCFCHNVSLVELKAAIVSGARTLDEIQAQTCASTGCGGCQFEVEDILAEELARLDSEEAS